MNNRQTGEVKSAHVEDGMVQYTAEYPDGTRITGILTRRYRPGSHLTDEALEQLAREIVGASVDPLPEGFPDDI